MSIFWWQKLLEGFLLQITTDSWAVNECESSSSLSQCYSRRQRNMNCERSVSLCSDSKRKRFCCSPREVPTQLEWPCEDKGECKNHFDGTGSLSNFTYTQYPIQGIPIQGINPEALLSKLLHKGCIQYKESLHKAWTLKHFGIFLVLDTACILSQKMPPCIAYPLLIVYMTIALFV